MPIGLSFFWDCYNLSGLVAICVIVDADALHLDDTFFMAKWLFAYKN